MSYYTSVNFYDLFEVGPRAGQAEIEAAYQRQLDMVSGNSLATYGLFVGEDVVSIRQRLEEAHHVLSDPSRRRAYDLEMFDHSFVSPDMKPPVPTADAPPKEERTDERRQTEGTIADRVGDVAEPEERTSVPVAKPEPVAKSTRPVMPELTEFDGPSLRAYREAQGLTLEAISARTKIAQYYLDYIEEERFGSLPPGIYLRSYLKQYAQAVGVNDDKLVTEYLARREAVEGG